jgi:lysophospholipase L1-like esterase
LGLNVLLIFLLYNTYVLRSGVRHGVEKLLKTAGISSYENVRNNGEYTDLYAAYQPKQANIVMLGDSVTHNVEWNELLGRDDVVNRGIGGDNTLGMLRRIGFVYKLHPKICFVMGGVNDMKDGISVEEVFDHYQKIVAGLKERGIIPVIQSTFYSVKLPAENTDRLNKVLKKYAEDQGLYYMDLNRSLAVNRSLKKELSPDGTHLNAKGYEVWKRELEIVLKKYGL